MEQEQQRSRDETGTSVPLARPAGEPTSPPPAFNVLVFSRTEGYRHSSIPAGIRAIQELATASSGGEGPPAPFHVHATEDAIVFNPSTLALYRVVVFLQASGEFLDNDAQLGALEGFVRGGGGVIGVHCASTGLPSSDFYGRLIGAVFTHHPVPQAATVLVEAPGHPILSGTTTTTTPRFQWFDEWYNFRANPRAAGAHILMTVQEDTYQGGTMGRDHPVAWCQDRQGARSFYTALGHFDDAYREPRFMRIIRNAILWTAQISI